MLGARRPDDSSVFVLSAVRYADGVTLASRTQTNEIPESAPLLDQIDDTDLEGVVVTADALHAPCDHATYLCKRGAHYLLPFKNDQRGQARQLYARTRKEIPVVHRDDARATAVTSSGSCRSSPRRACSSPHAAQVLRIQRLRRPYRAKKWSSETVYALTDLPAEEANAAEIAPCAPAVLAVLRDLIRRALKLAGYVNTAAGRRTHTECPRVVAASHDQTGRSMHSPGPCFE